MALLYYCVLCCVLFFFFCVVFFQAEDGIRYLVRSRGLGDVYKRQEHVGDVFLGRLTGSGLATIPGARGPVGAHAVQVLSLIHI